jgi:hypothetical protein
MKRVVAGLVLALLMAAGVAQTANFNNLTPAPPTSGTSVLWQKDVPAGRFPLIRLVVATSLRICVSAKLKCV